MNITTTVIGTDDRGIDGCDQFILLTRKDDDLTCDEAHNWFFPQVYRETKQEAGGYFCRDVEVLQRSTNSVVAIVHHRYDV